MAKNSSGEENAVTVSGRVILPQTDSLERIEQLFYTPVAHDLLTFE